LAFCENSRRPSPQNRQKRRCGTPDLYSCHCSTVQRQPHSYEFIPRPCNAWPERGNRRRTDWASMAFSGVRAEFLARPDAPELPDIFHKRKPHDVAHTGRRGCEGGAGTSSSCEQSNHTRSVRASGYGEETIGAEQARREGAKEGNGRGLIGPYRTPDPICPFAVSA